MKALKLFFLSLLTAMLTYGGNYLQRGPKVVEEINPENPINSLVYTDYFNMYKKIYLLNLYDYKGESTYSMDDSDCSKISSILKVVDMRGNAISSYCEQDYYEYGKLQFSMNTKVTSIKETKISYDISSFSGRYSKAKIIVTTDFKDGHNYQFWFLFVGILISILVLLSSLIVGCVEIYNYLNQNKKSQLN